MMLLGLKWLACNWRGRAVAGRDIHSSELDVPEVCSIKESIRMSVKICMAKIGYACQFDHN
jgi:hypothetical protein